MYVCEIEFVTQMRQRPIDKKTQTFRQHEFWVTAISVLNVAMALVGGQVGCLGLGFGLDLLGSRELERHCIIHNTSPTTHNTAHRSPPKGQCLNTSPLSTHTGIQISREKKSEPLFSSQKFNQQQQSHYWQLVYCLLLVIYL